MVLFVIGQAGIPSCDLTFPQEAENLPCNIAQTTIITYFWDHDCQFFVPQQRFHSNKAAVNVEILKDSESADLDFPSPSSAAIPFNK